MNNSLNTALGLVFFVSSLWLIYTVQKFASRTHQERNVNKSNVNYTLSKLLKRSLYSGLTLALIMFVALSIDKEIYQWSTGQLLFFPLFCFIVPFLVGFILFCLMFIHLKTLYKYGVNEDDQPSE